MSRYSYPPENGRIWIHCFAKASRRISTGVAGRFLSTWSTCRVHIESHDMDESVLCPVNSPARDHRSLSPAILSRDERSCYYPRVCSSETEWYNGSQAAQSYSHILTTSNPSATHSSRHQDGQYLDMKDRSNPRKSPAFPSSPLIILSSLSPLSLRSPLQLDTSTSPPSPAIQLLSIPVKTSMRVLLMQQLFVLTENTWAYTYCTAVYHNHHGQESTVEPGRQWLQNATFVTTLLNTVCVLVRCSVFIAKGRSGDLTGVQSPSYTWCGLERSVNGVCSQN